MADTTVIEVAPQVSGKRKGLAPKIRALRDKFPEMSKSAIARRVGCHPSNVDQVLGRYLGDVPLEDLRAYQENRADVFDALGHRFLLSVTQDKLDKTKPMEAVTAAAILYDKARLERGQATGINVSVLMDVAEAIRARGRQVVDSRLEPSS